MDEINSVGLDSLLGEHWLDAVDFDTISVLDWGTRYHNASVMRFRIDGTCYVAIEDPDDGYRSMLDSLSIDQHAVMKNSFVPVWVFGRWQDPAIDGDAPSEVIELVDMWTHQVILEVGTDHDDCYYPQFVSKFSPENMVINHKLD